MAFSASLTRSRLIPVALLLPVLLAAGCSGGDDEAAKPEKPARKPTGAPANTLDRTRALPAAKLSGKLRKLPAEVLDYEVQPDGRTVRMWVALPTDDTASCGLKAAEKQDEVKVTVTLCFPKTAVPPAEGDSPTAYVDVPLKAPLGTRALLDSTGLLIPHQTS
ncbi:hypothetical protein GCM10022221_46520 [Actinocorallia aurea]